MDEDLIAVVRAERMFESVAEEFVRVAQRRWSSYSRRHPKPPSEEDRLRDLTKGLRDHFEKDPSLGGDGMYREYEYVARKLAPLLDP